MLNRLQIVQLECNKYSVLCLIHFLEKYIFQFFSPAPARSFLPSCLRGNKELALPVRKAENWKINWNKISRTCCKWSNLNDPDIETPVSHPFLDNLFFTMYFWPLLLLLLLLSSLWGDKLRNWTSHYGE